MNFYEILKTKKLGRGSPDYWTQLFAEHVGGKGGWKVTELTDTLPITFRSNGTALINYRIYGTSEGAGVQTENLANMKNSGMVQVTATAFRYGVSWGKLADGNYTISFKAIGTTNLFITTRTGTRYSSAQLGNTTSVHTFTVNNADEVIFRSASTNVTTWSALGVSDVMLVEGSTAPTSYIPPGYKIPILNTSGVTENFYDDETSSDKKLLDGLGGLSNNSYYKTSDYIDCTGGSKINCYGVSVFDINRLVRIAFYDNNQAFLSEMDSEIFISGNYSFTFTAPQNARYFRFSFIRTDTDVSATLRYQSNYDLFIGSTKLGEAEYVDYGEQKIYKRILFMTHDDKHFITKDNKDFCLRRRGYSG